MNRLMELATSELQSQRSVTSKLRAKVQLQNTKLVQMKKKMGEIETRTGEYGEVRSWRPRECVVR